MSRFCNSCGGGKSPHSKGRRCNCKPMCNDYKPIPPMVEMDDCDCNFTIDELMHAPGQYIFNIDGCRAKLNIANGVKHLETVTHITKDNSGNIIYINENNDRETVNIKDLLPAADLEDLGNVDDNLGDGCAFLFKDKGGDIWKSWRTTDYTLKSDETAAGVMVFTTGGCPRYLPAPTDGLSTLVAKDGSVQWDTLVLPEGADQDKFHPAWGNINETHTSDLNTPDRQYGIFTHDPMADDCNDIIVG